MVVAGRCLLAGLALVLPPAVEHVRQGSRLSLELGHLSHMAVTGLLLLIIGFLIFGSTLVIHAAELRRSRRTYVP